MPKFWHSFLTKTIRVKKVQILPKIIFEKILDNVIITDIATKILRIIP